MSLALLLTTALCTCARVAPAEPQAPAVQTYTLRDAPLGTFQNERLPDSIADDRKILAGGLGSDLWHGPGDPADEFWMITDRGPNGQATVEGKARLTFPVPTFDPTIVHVKLEKGEIRIVEKLPILTASGKPVTGLPNSAHDETPYALDGEKALERNPNGLDTEGLVRTSQGDFWLCDEYAPSLVHVAKDGKVLKRYIPHGLEHRALDYPVAEALPSLYSKRKPNRGFEGLALSRDEKTLFVALQSPLWNPDDRTGDASRNARILAFDVGSETCTAEYLYVLEPAAEFEKGAKPKDMKISALVALDEKQLLVLERTDGTARLFTLALGQSLLGEPASASLESASGAAVEAWKPVKAPVRLEDGSDDLVHFFAGAGQHPVKVEGLALLDPSTIAFANDNDFDLDLKDGTNAGKGVKTQLFVVHLSAPLAATR